MDVAAARNSMTSGSDEIDDFKRSRMFLRPSFPFPGSSGCCCGSVVAGSVGGRLTMLLLDG